MPEEVKADQADTPSVDTTSAQTQPNQTLLGADEPQNEPENTDPLARDPNAKPEAEKPKEEKKDEKAKAEDKAPESYVEFKVPEGLSIEKETNEEFTALAKEMNLSQEKAQKLIDLAAKNASQGAKKFAEQQAQQWAKAREGWVAEIKADKEVGGANLPESLSLARRAVNRFGDNAVKEVFNSGMGDNPAMFKMFVKIGRAMSESKFVEGSRSVKERSSAEVIYGKPN